MDAGFALRALLALAVVGAVLWALRFLAVRLPVTAFRGRAGGRGRLLRVLESAALPSACSLHVVAVAGHYFVIGRSAANVVLLCELSGDQIGSYARSDRR